MWRMCKSGMMARSAMQMRKRCPSPKSTGETWTAPFYKVWPGLALLGLSLCIWSFGGCSCGWGREGGVRLLPCRGRLPRISARSQALAGVQQEPRPAMRVC